MTCSTLDTCAPRSRKRLRHLEHRISKSRKSGRRLARNIRRHRNAYRFIKQIAPRYSLDPSRIFVMGHSAGGQLALCLAAHEPSVHGACFFAGVIDLRRAFDLHLSNDAVVDFLGGKPTEVADHYREADPMRSADSALPTVCDSWAQRTTMCLPNSEPRLRIRRKRKTKRMSNLVEIAKADHFDLIDPRSAAWPGRSESTGTLLCGRHPERSERSASDCRPERSQALGKASDHLPQSFPGPEREFTPNALPRQFFLQIAHLPHMQMQMCRASQKNVETVSASSSRIAVVRLRPVRFCLRARGPCHHRHGIIEAPHHFVLLCTCRLR